MEMQLRSGRRLRPWQGAAHRGRGGEDRLSALPDALLLLVLARLGSTNEVVRTSGVARRWRPLWTELDVLVFHDVDPYTLAGLLASARHPNLSRLEIQISRLDRGLPPSQLSWLLRAAEEHNPGELEFKVRSRDYLGIPFQLPCFARATSINLRIWNRNFVLSPAGTFSRLERLTLSLCCVDPAEFLPRCPRLRVLEMDCFWLQHAVDVQSASLEELALNDMPHRDADDTPRRVNIAAPMLREFKLQTYGDVEMMASFSAPAPMVETISFRYYAILSRAVGLADSQLHVMDLSTAMEWRIRNGQLDPVRVRVLSLVVVFNASYEDASRSFAEEIAGLPVSNFSIFKLKIQSMWHDFGAVVFDSLKAVTAIQMLELVLPQTMDRVWAPRRYFDYDPDDWTNEDISLPNLEEMEVERFHLIDHDLDVLEVLFTSAPKLKTVRIQLPGWASQSGQGYRQLCSILWENTSVKCYINGRPLEESGESLPPAGPPS
ncbi:hypothetical protein C2845_PM05G08480 [Panicum miliaceum]|uniref:F-box domain-containing protein n=1 Tax=Panicum miliaceum TaxID=4540 RepID=A0A3L6T6M7_PANMI|nr:hypothetical protein C2845_PM05G08480 [Panicum miliaceum]